MYREYIMYYYRTHIYFKLNEWDPPIPENKQVVDVFFFFWGGRLTVAMVANETGGCMIFGEMNQMKVLMEEVFLKAFLSSQFCIQQEKRHLQLNAATHTAYLFIYIFIFTAKVNEMNSTNKVFIYSRYI